MPSVAKTRKSRATDRLPGKGHGGRLWKVACGAVCPPPDPNLTGAAEKGQDAQRKKAGGENTDCFGEFPPLTPPVPSANCASSPVQPRAIPTGAELRSGRVETWHQRGAT